MSICLTAVPSNESLDKRSLALALLATPRLTMLSNRVRGLLPGSSYELGRVCFLEFVPSISLWKRPRCWRGLSSSDSGRPSEEGAGEGDAFSPETVRGKGTGGSLPF